MKNELGTAGATVGALALVLLFGGLTLAIYPGWGAIGGWLSRIDAPAWVQAVGSVTAILAAIWIALSSERSRKREKEESSARETALAIAIVDRLNSFCKTNSIVYTAAVHTTPALRAAFSNTLNQQFSALLQTPLWQLENSILSLEISSLQLQANLAISELEHGRHSGGSAFYVLREQCESFLTRNRRVEKDIPAEVGH